MDVTSCFMFYVHKTKTEKKTPHRKAWNVNGYFTTALLNDCHSWVEIKGAITPPSSCWSSVITTEPEKLDYSRRYRRVEREDPTHASVGRRFYVVVRNPCERKQNPQEEKARVRADPTTGWRNKDLQSQAAWDPNTTVLLVFYIHPSSAQTHTYYSCFTIFRTPTNKSTLLLNTTWTLWVGATFSYLTFNTWRGTLFHLRNKASLS